jgi:hypothetical protein
LQATVWGNDSWCVSPDGTSLAYDYPDMNGYYCTSILDGTTERQVLHSDDDLLALVRFSGEATTWAFSYNSTHTVSQVKKNDGKTWTFAHDSGNRLTGASDENNPCLPGTLDIG